MAHYKKKINTRYSTAQAQKQVDIIGNVNTDKQDTLHLQSAHEKLVYGTVKRVVWLIGALKLGALDCLGVIGSWSAFKSWLRTGCCIGSTAQPASTDEKP